MASATGLSRRAADEAIKSNRVIINGRPAILGDTVKTDDHVTLDNRSITPDVKPITIMFNKPVGYVCSRKGQGSKTIYDLLPKEYRHLKAVGRLDKDSSGLLLLTSDGDLANQLTHPKYKKNKVYRVRLDKDLNQKDEKKLITGVRLDDGLSKFIRLNKYSHATYEVTLGEGRNRQIRRTFNALDYKVERLHRIQFGPYKIEGLVTDNITVLKT